MCSRFLRLAAVFLVTSCCYGQLRVCADPNNLPFSNRKQQGFENRIAELLARELHQKLEYTWQRMGRGFVRNILNKRECDVLLGIPQNFRPVLTTVPYYRSTYVFVAPKKAGVHLASFDDVHLKNMKIGVQVLGEEYAPPGQALGRRGLIANLVGFDEPAESTSSVMSAVLRQKVDAAVVWGPTAGYFAKAHPNQLELAPTPDFDPPALPLAFSISMGVRKSDVELRDRLNEVISRRKTEIERILRSYNVPLLASAGQKAGFSNR